MTRKARLRRRCLASKRLARPWNRCSGPNFPPLPRPAAHNRRMPHWPAISRDQWPACVDRSAAGPRRDAGTSNPKIPSWREKRSRHMRGPMRTRRVTCWNAKKIPRSVRRQRAFPALRASRCINCLSPEAAGEALPPGASRISPRQGRSRTLSRNTIASNRRRAKTQLAGTARPPPSR